LRPRVTSGSSALAAFPYLVLLLGLLVAEVIGRVSAPVALALLTLQLLAYLFFESIHFARLSHGHFLLAAPIACSFFTFALPFGITNALYLIPVESRPPVLDIAAQITPAMLKLMVLAIIGAFGMWLGFRSKAGAALGRVLLVDLRLSKTLARTFDLRPVVVIALVCVALTARFIAIRLNVYGYSADIGSLEESAGVRQFLTIADGGGKAALLLVALAAFGPNARSDSKAGLIGLLLVEIGFGFLSGFKSQVVMPIVIVTIAYYVQRGRIPRFALPMIALAIVGSYQVIQPFRALKYEDSAFRATSVISISEALVRAQGAPGASEGDAVDTFFQTASRQHGTYVASFGIEYADDVPELPADAPKFIQDILLTPLYAIIPRAFWPDKPAGGIVGKWYRMEVMGIDDETSVGMSPLTYLYLGGGYIAVLLGFVGVGILQRAAMNLASAGAGGVFIYLGLLGTLAQIDSAFNSVPINLIRDGACMWLVQRLALRK
jgi:hypothetical protein